MTRSIVLALATFLLPACLSSIDVEDGADDTFTAADGKADAYGLSAAEVAGVLDLVNSATQATLQNDVGLSARVARNITVHRAGADKKLGTADDNPFGDLEELDAVPYVGARVFAVLLDYARAHGYVHDDHGGAGFCKTEHAGKTPSGASVMVCDALYDQAPFVHVPADTTSGSTITTYGGVLNGIGLTLTTVDGRALPLVDSSGQTYGISKGPSGFKAPENLFAIYSVSGTMTSKAGEDAIKVKSLTPVAWVPGAVQDKLLLGTWEAQASGRVGPNRFDETKPVTIRFTLSSTADNTALWKSYGGDGLIDSGTIDNLAANVTSADGKCLPSLASLGAASPFYQATNDHLSVWRHPNMHGLNDQVVVIDYPTGSADLSPNGMGWIKPFSISGLVAASGPGYQEVEVRPHATPNGHKVWGFTKVTTGGSACN